MRNYCFRVLLLLSILGFGSSTVLAQRSRDRVTLDLKDVSIMEVLKAIEQQTDYVLEYHPDDVRVVPKRVNVRVKNGDVDNLLKGILNNTPLRYKISGKKIVITNTQSKWITVVGRVMDENGLPLAGATVRIKGQQKGAITDADGNYAVRVPSLKATSLIVSFVGMHTQELVPQSNKLNVTLKENVQALSGVEIESTGYTETNKRLSTSSIFTISGEDVLETNMGSLDNMLMGKIPGMTVLTDISTPGAAAKIRVRGVSTISGSREPLWVVDGIILDDPVPLSPEEINSLDNINLIGNAIQGLNPQDIEKIDILKDAAATALYGVRAANGVIVVSTKRGREGHIRFNYTGSVTLNQRPNYGQMGLMNSKERIELSKEIEERHLPFLFTVSRIGYEGALMDFYDRKLTETEFLEKVKTLEETNTDWFELLFRNTLTQRHNFSLSGGSEKVSYYASANLSSNPDVVKDKGVQSYSGMVKLNFRPSSKITGMVQMRVSGSDKNYTYSGVSPYSYAINTSRAIPAFDENGDRVFYNGSQGHQTQLRFNEMNELDHTGNTVKNNGYNLTAYLQYKPIVDLTISSTFGMNASSTFEKSWYDEESYEAAQLRRVNHGDPLPDSEVFRKESSKLPYGGRLRSMNMRNTSWQWRAQVIYNWRPWEDHVFSINAGPEFRSVQYAGLQSNEFGYLPDRGESFMNIDPAVWLAYNNYKKQYRDQITNRFSNFVSVFANLTYSYKQKYILTYNVRAEGSNKFGQDKRARFLPIWSLSGRWNIHQEDFLRDALWINMLAIKGSYGLQGNVSDEQTPNMIMRFGEYDDLAGQFESHISKLPNPLLRWEKNSSYNVGFETALFNNRLTFNIDYYVRKGTDQLISKSISQTLGKSSIQINAGTLLNQGIDAMLTFVPIRTKDWTWSVNLNGSRNSNKVTDGGVNNNYTYSQYLNGTAIINGNPIDAFYSYKFKGLNDKGTPEFYGLEETGKGETKEEFFGKMFVKSGDRVPFSQGGIGTTLRHKGFTLNLFFSYSLGKKVRLNNLYSDHGQRTPQPFQNLSDELVDRWKKPGDEAHTNIPVLTADPLDDVAFRPYSPISGKGGVYKYEFALNRWQMYNKSDLRVVDGSHLRLRSASLSYMVPEAFCQKVGMKNINLRLEGYNLLLFSSKKLRGQDPSQITLGSRATPPLPSFSFKVDLSF